MPPHQVAALRPAMTAIFVRYVFYASLLHLAFVVTTAVQFTVTPRYTLWFRAVLVFRLLLLWSVVLRVCCGCCCLCRLRVVAVDELNGVGAFWKIPRTFSAYPTLNVWFLLGAVELFLLRIPAVVIDALSPLNGADVRDAATWVTVDVFLVFEFYAAVHLIYFIGVRKAVLVTTWNLRTQTVDV